MTENESLIEIESKILTRKSTVSDLCFDGTFVCNTLEDPVRDQKIYGETAIPAGTYRVVMNHSPRFGMLLPMLVDVPNYTDIYFHWGNFPKDTLGCILTGITVANVPDFVGFSRKTFFEKFLPRVDSAFARGSLRCTVTRAASE